MFLDGIALATILCVCVHMTLAPHSAFLRLGDFISDEDNWLTNKTKVSEKGVGGCVCERAPLRLIICICTEIQNSTSPEPSKKPIAYLKIPYTGNRVVSLPRYRALLPQKTYLSMIVALSPCFTCGK